MNVRTIAASALAATAASLALSAVPAAAAPKLFTTYSSGTCDSTTGEWVVDWEISNLAGEPATLSTVVSLPAASPITGLPTSVAGGATVHAGQRIAGSGGQSASLTYTATWADGTSTPNTWYFRPWTPCAKVVPTSYSGPVLDADGTARGSLQADAGFLNVCDQLADGVTVAAEAKLSDGSTLRRIAPLGGCTPAFSNGLKIIAIRGLANDFANPWHEIG